MSGVTLAMMALKVVHILAAVVFLGTGFGSAWYKLRADCSGDLAVITWAQREIVRADWLFTIPAGIALPITGAALVHLYRLPWSTPWVVFGFAGYLIAGLCWLPAAWLQLRMRRDAEASLEAQKDLPERFHRDRKVWFLLGIPSFLAAIATVWVMVTKTVW